MIDVEIYTKPDCHLCDKAKSVLNDVSEIIPFNLVEIDITKKKDDYDAYKEQIPVVFINGKKAFKFRVESSRLIKKLKQAK